MEVQIGEKVTLQAQNIIGAATYKWVVKKGTEILNTQTTTSFNYTFDQQGEYYVNLTVTDTSGKAKNTSITVIAGDRFPRPAGTPEVGTTGGVGETPLIVELSTLPPSQTDGSVHLIGDGKVLFTIESREDILEYRIDKNIFTDSDGNGIANDDIDNANDRSYLQGGSWEASYKTGEASKSIAEITLVSKTGKKAKKQVEIVFDAATRKEGDPLAILDSTPLPDSQDQLIHLYGDRATVGFYAKRSEGKILEYRIDKNIFVDSNKDGNPANDIDNLNDISFKTGDVWKTDYEKTDGTIIAQLIVVGENGKGSRVQRGLWFTDKPKTIPVTESGNGIRLVADKEFVMKGDPVVFRVEGLTLSLSEYTFAWDLNGDGTVEKTIEGDNTLTQIYDTANTYPVSVTVTDKSKNSGVFKLDFVVKDTVTTMADFELVVEGNTVKFTNKSVAAWNLTNKNLSYTWSFGDTDTAGYEAQKDQITAENPTYTYNKAGKYIVTLTVTDADQVFNTKTAEVVMEKDLKPAEAAPATTEETQAGGTSERSSGGSVVGLIFKIIGIILLIAIVLVVFTLGGFFIYLKVKNPALSFEELIEELKIKILKMLGVHEMITPVPSSSPSSILEGEVTSNSAQKEEDNDDVTVQKVHPPLEGPAPLEKQDGPVPDWLKGVK